MSVFFSNENIHVQFIDDTAGKTLAAASTLSKATPDREKLGANVTSAKTIGTLAAKTALDKGIKAVAFDRGGARFHGKVKALADAAREAGLQF
jgi:large subunit ribosomal protein L18